MVALEPDEWSHVVGTWDGATLHMYHNGVLADSVPYSPLTRTLTLTPTLTLTLALTLTLTLALTRATQSSMLPDGKRARVTRE